MIHDEEPVGLVGCFEDDGECEVVSMWVDLAWRGKGVVDALLQAVERHARTSGYSELVLDVKEGNERAIRAYRRNGFAVVGRAAESDEIRMAKPLPAGS